MAALLNRGWRLIGTALGFTLFGVGGLLLSLFWFPLLALCLRGERRRTLAQLRAGAHFVDILTKE